MPSKRSRCPERRQPFLERGGVHPLYRHTVAVWMGNLDGSAMDGVTGAVGPAMVLRSLFSALNRDQDTRPLDLSRDLIAARICRRDGRLADATCESMNEWFVPGTQPSATESGVAAAAALTQYRVLQPTAGLEVAHDPRIPEEFQKLPMNVNGVPGLERVDWYVDGALVARTGEPRYAWPLQAGTHDVKATVWTVSDSNPAEASHSTEDIRFYVH